MSKVRNLPELTSPEQTDLLYAVDESVGTNGGRKITIATIKTATELTDAEVKVKYENNPNTNAFTDAEKTKLAGIEPGATADQVAAEVPYDDTSTLLGVNNVQSAIEKLDILVDFGFSVKVVSGLIIQYSEGRVTFDGVFTNILPGGLVLAPNITNGFLYVDVDAIVKQTGSSVTPPPYTVPIANFTTNSSNTLSLVDIRTKVNQSLVRGILSDVGAIGANNVKYEGDSKRLADADHDHDVVTGPAVGLDPASTNTTGVGNALARADHTHQISTALVADITTILPDNTTSAGTVDKYARGDHRHAISTDVPVVQNADQTNTKGISTSFARADHIHNIPTAVPSTQNATNVNTQGSSTSFAKADHLHAISTGTPSTQNTDQTNTTGTSSNLARADHIHNIPTGIPVTNSTSSSNAQGSSTSFSRADHIHEVTIANQEATATADDTTTSATDVLMVGMTQTPVAGTYLAMFSGSIVNSANGSERTWISLYLGGAQVSATERSMGSSGGVYIPSSTFAIITANGSQAIELRWRVAGGTSTVHSRRLTLLRLD